MRRRYRLAKCARCGWLVQFNHEHDTDPVGVWYHPSMPIYTEFNPCSEPVPADRRPLCELLAHED